MKIEEFIRKHRQVLNLSQIERLCNIPTRTLHRIPTNERRFPKKYLEIFFDELWKVLEDLELTEKYELK